MEISITINNKPVRVIISESGFITAIEIKGQLIHISECPVVNMTARTLSAAHKTTIDAQIEAKHIGDQLSKESDLRESLQG